MTQITRDSLWSLERYARERPAFRAKVIEHKKARKVFVGEHVLLEFEDELTVRYQIQEMLRVERTFEERGILDEMDAYNPLIPDGRNLKATMMIEYPDEAERAVALAGMRGIEDRTWVQVGGHDRVYAIADEDIDRENDEKTSSVHFLRFELAEPMAQALKTGAALAVGVDHPAYVASVDPVSADVRASLAADMA
jgi:hypothetical protein